MEIETKILNIMEVSQRVSDFMVEGNYFHPTEDSTGRSLPDVLIDCMKIIFDELQQMGITSHHEETLLFDSYRNEAAICLRELFDEDTLKLFIGNLSVDEREMMKTLLDAKDPDMEINLPSIIAFMEGSGITSNLTIRFNEYSTDYQLSSDFYSRVNNLLEETTPKQVDTQKIQAMIIRYLSHEHEHLRKVKQAVNHLMNVIPLEKNQSLDLRTRMSIHDGDLIYGSSLAEAASMWNIKEQEKPDADMLKLAMSFKLNHFKRNRHHMSYFEGKESEISIEDLIEITADRYDEQKTKEDYLKDVKEVFTKVELSPETQDKILQVADKLNMW